MSGRNISRIEMLLILGALSAFAPMAVDMYLPALPTLEHVFAASAASVQVSLATFFLGFALGQVFYGPVTDRFGRRPPLYFGLVLFTAASLGCIFAPSIEVLNVLRFCQAIGACSGAVIARAVVRDRYDSPEALQIFSLLMLVMGVAPILAPLIGGYLLVWFGWTSIFWLLTGFGALCLWATIFRLPETMAPELHRPMHLRPVLSVFWLLLRDRHYLGFALASGASMGGMFAYIAGSPFVFITHYHVPAQDFGWLFGINSVGIIIASQINHRLAHRIGSERLLQATFVVQAIAGIAMLIAAATGFGGLLGLAVPLFFYVASIGIVMPLTTALAMAPHPDKAGMASALFGTLQYMYGAVTAVLVGAFHDGSGISMAGTIAVCGIGGLALLWALVGNNLRITRASHPV